MNARPDLPASHARSGRSTSWWFQVRPASPFHAWINIPQTTSQLVFSREADQTLACECDLTEIRAVPTVRIHTARHDEAATFLRRQR